MRNHFMYFSRFYIYKIKKLNVLLETVSNLIFHHKFSPSPFKLN
jgi:hypothetical protein